MHTHKISPPLIHAHAHTHTYTHTHTHTYTHTHTHTAETAPHLASAPSEVRELAVLWQSYADNAEGPAMTRLCVSLAGKISPTDINMLIAVARANLQYLMHHG